MSFLAVKKIDELFDFQKNGFFANWLLSLTKAPTDTVIPLDFEILNGRIITVMEARKVEIINESVNLLSTLALINSRNITAIDNFTGGYKVTTSLPHYYTITDKVTQSSFTGGDVGYNGLKTIVTIPTSTTYTIAGTYTSSKIGVVTKNAVAITKTGNYYFIPAREKLPSLLNSGLYYYYFYDELTELKSELFCIDENIISFSRAFANNNNSFLVDNNGSYFITI